MFPWPAIAISGAAAAWLSVVGLAGGGLAELVIALASGAFLGLPIANATQRLPKDAPLQRYARALRMLIAVVVLGGVLTSTPLPPMYRAGLAGTLWLAACILGPRPWAIVGVAGLGFVVFCAPFTLGSWTLLEPHWSGGAQWWASAAATGLLLTSAGGSAWRDRTRSPVLSLGTGLLGLVAMALVLAYQWDGGWNAVSAVGLLLAFGVLLGVTDRPSPNEPYPHALSGALLVMLFAVVEPAGAVVAIHTVFPLALGLFALLLSSHSQRLPLIAVAVVLALIAYYAWDGLPDHIPSAVAIALLPVVLVWSVGTRVIQPTKDGTW